MNKFYSIFIVGLLISQNHLFSSVESIQYITYSEMTKYFMTQVSNNIKNKQTTEVYTIPTRYLLKTKSSKGRIVLLNYPPYLTACINAIMDLRKKNLIGPGEGLSDLGALSKELQGSVWGNSENIPKNLIEQKTYRLQPGIFVGNDETIILKFDETIILEFKQKWYRYV